MPDEKVQFILMHDKHIYNYIHFLPYTLYVDIYTCVCTYVFLLAKIQFPIGKHDRSPRLVTRGSRLPVVGAFAFPADEDNSMTTLEVSQ